MTRHDRFRCWFDELAAIGRTQWDGWRRFAWTPEDRAARAWFERTAESLCLVPYPDPNGNLWAWWGAAGPGAVVTGSHLDTVADGGAFDGALGILSAFLAIDDLQTAAGNCVSPPTPIAVVAFADEEGGRFNLPCFGSRLMTGALDPTTALGRKDADGVTVAQALADVDVDPSAIGPDPERLRWIGTFVELHIEQGRGLVDTDAAVAIGTGIWPHGRWRVTFTGEANHAGTTRMEDRRDALAAAGALIDWTSRPRGDVRSTIGRVLVEPNSPNTIPRRATAWLDARGPDDDTLDGFVSEWTRAAEDFGIECEVVCDSRTPGVEFDPKLIARITERLDAAHTPVVPLATAAGHDAGILAAHVPAAMLFVRNPTGASHTPAEVATVDDCLAGADALRRVLEDLAWQ
jgi:N-carbamoyl-L-amino-acid hydrolase